VDWLAATVRWFLDAVMEYAREHPLQTAIAVLAFIRLWGTTVQSGSKGVLFAFGRVRKELEPGFHPLLPIVHTVRKTPVRSITLELPPQQLTTADDLVYDVRANLVYRVADPSVALVQVVHLRAAIEAVVAVIVQDMVRGRTRAELLAREGLDAELAARAAEKLRRWGVAVEQAGFQSIAPTHRTLRLTQLALLAEERHRAVAEYVRHGLAPTTAVALLGADRHCIAHSTARYRRMARRRPIPARTTAPRPGVPVPRADHAVPAEPHEPIASTIPTEPARPAAAPAPAARRGPLRDRRRPR
jgi:hypothetical protein